MLFDCLEIILEILCDAFVEVCTLVSAHVVRFARIDEEVGLCALLDTFLEERQSVLWNNHGIIHADDDLEFSLQVLGFGQYTGFCVAIRVVLGCAHIAFAIPHLIPFPVNDRTTGNSYLEHIGVCGHQ